MVTQADSPTTVALPPRLAEVFRLLRSGRHICREDISEFRDLERNEGTYRTLFSGLGYELIHHGQGFYYLKGGGQLSTLRLQAISLFTLLLFQDLEERKFQDSDRGWERTLLTRHFKVVELPHFQTSERRSLLRAVEVTPESLHERVLRPMVRYGLIAMTGPEQFRFRSPIYRFVDVCLQFAEPSLSPAAMVELQPEATDQSNSTDDALQPDSAEGEQEGEDAR